MTRYSPMGARRFRYQQRGATMQHTDDIRDDAALSDVQTGPRPPPCRPLEVPKPDKVQLASAVTTPLSPPPLTLDDIRIMLGVLCVLQSFCTILAFTLSALRSSADCVVWTLVCALLFLGFPACYMLRWRVLHGRWVHWSDVRGNVDGFIDTQRARGYERVNLLTSEDDSA